MSTYPGLDRTNSPKTQPVDTPQMPRDRQLVPQLLGELGECINCVDVDLKALTSILYPIMVQRVASSGGEMAKPSGVNPECEMASILRELIENVTNIHRTVLRITSDVQV